MDAAAEAGITFFDTADMYPNAGTFESMGATKTIIGEWMHGRRDEFILASTSLFLTGKQPWMAGNSRHNIVRSIEETLSALDDLVRSGKVRQGPLCRLLEHDGVADRPCPRPQRGARPLQVRECAAALQPPVPRKRTQTLPLCAKECLAVMPCNPLAGGLLTGNTAAPRPQAPASRSERRLSATGTMPDSAPSTPSSRLPKMPESQ